MESGKLRENVNVKLESIGEDKAVERVLCIHGIVGIRCNIIIYNER